MNKTVYIIGYSNFRPYQIEEIAECLNATIVDIRLRAWSRNAQYCKSNLQERFGDHYIHIPNFGNTNYKDHNAPHILRDFDTGALELSDVEGTVILMCMCKSEPRCHRSKVAFLLREHGFANEVYEIAHYSQVAYFSNLQPSLF